MEEIISLYRRLIDQLDDEYANISHCFQGDLLSSYREILEKEREKIEAMLHTLY